MKENLSILAVNLELQAQMDQIHPLAFLNWRIFLKEIAPRSPVLTEDPYVLISTDPIDNSIWVEKSYKTPQKASEEALSLTNEEIYYFAIDKLRLREVIQNNPFTLTGSDSKIREVVLA